MFYIKSHQDAKTLENLFILIKENPNAQIIAGGTDILIKNRERKKNYINRNLINIMSIPEFKKITMDTDGNIFIGSTLTFSEIENNTLIKKHLKSLSIAASSVGGPQLRNVGTIGGNICNGATSADTAPVLLTYNAIVIILNKNNKEKQIPLNLFYLNSGKVDLQSGDLVKGFLIKKSDYDGFGSHYIKFSQREAMDIAILSCAVLLKTNKNKIEAIKIAYGVASPTPIRALKAEKYGKNLIITSNNLLKLGKKCLDSTNPRSSWRASKIFREQLIKTLPLDAIDIILGEKKDE